MKTLFLSLLLPLLSHADAPSTHGMLVVGKEKIYFSHLPMFHQPHDYQGIYEATLPAAATAAYKKSLGEFPEEKVYTIVPEQFDLAAMSKAQKPFKAQLFRGHFERGGTPITAQVTVSMKTLHFEKLDAKAKEASQAKAILFGMGKDLFLAHKIGGKPDFDQILSVSGQAPGGAKQLVELPEHAAKKPLQGSGKLQIKFAGKTAELERLGEIYLEFGDLSH